MPNRDLRPRPRLARLLNEPYEQIRTRVPDGRVQLVYAGDGWVASVWQDGVGRPAASAQGATQEEALRALAGELGLGEWTP